MSQTQAILSHPLPYKNYFQYPPPKRVTPPQDSINNNLLSGDRSRGNLFTTFVSIPYCRVKCHSCPFFKELLPARSDQGWLLKDYVDCVIAQMNEFEESRHFAESECGAFFFGGGTASLLAPHQVADILNAHTRSFRHASNVEITLEGNPKEFSQGYLQQVKGAGINRLSIGLQSFQEKILRRVINSPHNSLNSRDSLEAALQAGFNTVNVDLLYRLPGQTLEDWRLDVEMAVRYGPESITFYSYVVHEGSASEKLIGRGTLAGQAGKDSEHEWYVWTADYLRSHGYVEGMKGNFAKPGHEQMYGKLSYLECAEIMGLGAGTYSFIDRRLFSTPSEPELYKQLIRDGRRLPVERISARATDRNMMERYVIFNFMASKLDRRTFRNRFGADPVAAFPEAFLKLQEGGLVEIDGLAISLTDLGKKWREYVLNEFYTEGVRSSEAA